MSTNSNDIPGFHGDGDYDTEIQHGGTSYWTKKATVWSVVMISVVVVVGGLIIMKMYGVI